MPRLQAKGEQIVGEQQSFQARRRAGRSDVRRISAIVQRLKAIRTPSWGTVGGSRRRGSTKGMRFSTPPEFGKDATFRQTAEWKESEAKLQTIYDEGKTLIKQIEKDETLWRPSVIKEVERIERAESQAKFSQAKWKAVGRFKRRGEPKRYTSKKEYGDIGGKYGGYGGKAGFKSRDIKTHVMRQRMPVKTAEVYKAVKSGTKRLDETLTESTSQIPKGKPVSTVEPVRGIVPFGTRVKTFFKHELPQAIKERRFPGVGKGVSVEAKTRRTVGALFPIMSVVSAGYKELAQYKSDELFKAKLTPSESRTKKQKKLVLGTEVIAGGLGLSAGVFAPGKVKQFVETPTRFDIKAFQRVKDVGSKTQATLTLQKGTIHKRIGKEPIESLSLTGSAEIAKIENVAVSRGSSVTAEIGGERGLVHAREYGVTKQLTAKEFEMAGVTKTGKKYYGYRGKGEEITEKMPVIRDGEKYFKSQSKVYSEDKGIRAIGKIKTITKKESKVSSDIQSYGSGYGTTITKTPTTSIDLQKDISQPTEKLISEATKKFQSVEQTAKELGKELTIGSGIKTVGFSASKSVMDIKPTSIPSSVQLTPPKQKAIPKEKDMFKTAYAPKLKTKEAVGIKPAYAPKQKPYVGLEYKAVQITKPATKLKPVQQFKPPIQELIPKKGMGEGHVALPALTDIPIITPPKAPPIYPPPFGFRSLGLPRGRQISKIGKKRKKKYKPSLVGIELGIKAPKGFKTKTFTGLEVRGLSSKQMKFYSKPKKKQSTRRRNKK